MQPLFVSPRRVSIQGIDPLKLTSRRLGAFPSGCGGEEAVSGVRQGNATVGTGGPKDGEGFARGSVACAAGMRHLICLKIKKLGTVMSFYAILSRIMLRVTAEIYDLIISLLGQRAKLSLRKDRASKSLMFVSGPFAPPCSSCR